MQHGCVHRCVRRVRRARSRFCYAPFCKTATCRKSATDRVADLSRVHCTVGDGVAESATSGDRTWDLSNRLMEYLAAFY